MIRQRVLDVVQLAQEDTRIDTWGEALGFWSGVLAIPILCAVYGLRRVRARRRSAREASEAGIDVQTGWTSVALVMGARFLAGAGLVLLIASLANLLGAEGAGWENWTALAFSLGLMAPALLLQALGVDASPDALHRQIRARWAASHHLQYAPLAAVELPSGRTFVKDALVDRGDFAAFDVLGEKTGRPIAHVMLLAWLPSDERVRVTRSDQLATAFVTAGRRVEFESEDFNRRFTVTASVPRYAYDVFQFRVLDLLTHSDIEDLQLLQGLLVARHDSPHTLRNMERRRQHLVALRGAVPQWVLTQWAVPESYVLPIDVEALDPRTGLAISLG